MTGSGGSLSAGRSGISRRTNFLRSTEIRRGPRRRGVELHGLVLAGVNQVASIGACRRAGA